MSLTQRIPIPPLKDTDRKSIKDTFSALNTNLQDLFLAAHEHSIRTTAPASTEGEVNSIIPVNLDGTLYLYVKFPSPINWARVQLTQV